MATNYNITMKQFNGTDYDNLYPAANLSNSIGKIQASQVEGLSITPDMGDVTGTLAVSHGGTGRATLTSGYYLVGNGTGAVTLQSPSQLQSSLGLDQYAKIQTGSYTGTGTYGSSNPNSLTFNFSVKLISLSQNQGISMASTGDPVRPNNWIFSYWTTTFGIFVLRGLNQSTLFPLADTLNENATFVSTFTSLSNGINYYSPHSANLQYNSSSTYYYVVLGV